MNFTTRTPLTPALIAAFCIGFLDTTSLRAAEPVSGLPVEIAHVAVYDFGQDRAPLQAAEVWLRGLNGAARLDAERMLLGQLGRRDLKDGARDFIIRSLALVGSQESVGSLVGLLPDPKWGSVALNSLAAIPEPEAELAMIRALSTTEPHVRVALMSVMARRRITGSVAALRVQVSCEDESVAAAALLALGEIGTPEAFQGLRENQVGPALAPLRIRALVTVAARLTEGAGVPMDLRPALANFCRQLISGNYDEQFKVSALRTLVKVSGGAASPDVLAALTGGSPALRRMAAQSVPQSIAPELVAAVGTRWAALGVEDKIIILEGLADRAERAARPLAVLTLDASESSMALRGSAIRALGASGSSADFPRLLALIEKQDELSPASATSLSRLVDPSLDALIRARLADAPPALAAVLLEVAAQRADKQAFPIACRQLEQGGSSDASLRASAAEALVLLAEPKDLQRIVNIVLLQKAGPELRGLEKCLQIIAPMHEAPEEAAGVLIRASQVAAPHQLRGLRIALACMDTPPAAAFLREGLSSGNRDAWREIVRAMGNSKLFSNGSTLLAEARAASGSDRLLAVRSLLLLISQCTMVDTPLRAQLYIDAWPLAERTEERDAIQKDLRWMKPDVAARLRSDKA